MERCGVAHVPRGRLPLLHGSPPRSFCLPGRCSACPRPRHVYAIGPVEEDSMSQTLSGHFPRLVMRTAGYMSDKDACMLTCQHAERRTLLLPSETIFPLLEWYVFNTSATNLSLSRPVGSNCFRSIRRPTSAARISSVCGHAPDPKVRRYMHIFIMSLSPLRTSLNWPGGLCDRKCWAILRRSVSLITSSSAMMLIQANTMRTYNDSLQATIRPVAKGNRRYEAAHTRRAVLSIRSSLDVGINHSLR